MLLTNKYILNMKIEISQKQSNGDEGRWGEGIV